MPTAEAVDGTAIISSLAPYVSVICVVPTQTVLLTTLYAGCDLITFSSLCTATSHSCAHWFLTFKRTLAWRDGSCVASDDCELLDR